jgi:hypothetical protein
MSNVNHEINLALRTAAGHERAAQAAEAVGAKQYEMKMVSAGAAAYGAFALAIKAAPEYQGRKIDDSAIRRIYSSTKARPWWDAHLKAVKVEGEPAGREWGKRLIQWHIDPEAAKARRAHGNARRLANHAKTQKKAEARGGQRSPQAAAPSTAEMRVVQEALQNTALAARDFAPSETEEEQMREAMLGELNRLSVAVRKIAPGYQGAVREILRVTAGEVERYVP